jgi:hypothetical protein
MAEWVGDGNAIADGIISVGGRMIQGSVTLARRSPSS